MTAMSGNLTAKENGDLELVLTISDINLQLITVCEGGGAFLNASKHCSAQLALGYELHILQAMTLLMMVRGQAESFVEALDVIETNIEELGVSNQAHIQVLGEMQDMLAMQVYGLITHRHTLEMFNDFVDHTNLATVLEVGSIPLVGSEHPDAADEEWWADQISTTDILNKLSAAVVTDEPIVVGNCKFVKQENGWRAVAD